MSTKGKKELLHFYKLVRKVIKARILTEKESVDITTLYMAFVLENGTSGGYGDLLYSRLLDLTSSEYKRKHPNRSTHLSRKVCEEVKRFAKRPATSTIDAIHKRMLREDIKNKNWKSENIQQFAKQEDRIQ